MLKLVTVYAILVHILRFDSSELETHASGARGTYLQTREGLPGWGFLILMEALGFHYLDPIYIY
jgi:hypothetical protein